MKNHWLRALVDWWIDKDGFPIKERAGVVRHFIRVDNKVIWVDASHRDEDGTPPKSFTFIAAKYTDNKIGLSKDPGYTANLNAQERQDRKRLKDGNWNATDESAMFDRSWFEIIQADKVPKGIRKMRYWDRAATEKTEKNPDPDWTAGALCGQKDGVLYIFDMAHFQANPLGNEERIKGAAEIDGRFSPIYIEKEGGSAGSDTIDHYQRTVLRGYIVVGDRPTGEKRERAKGWCALAERGNVKLVAGPWNHNFLAEIEAYPFGKKDQVDAVSGAYKFLLGKSAGSILDLVKD
jgi:predicted phage terminase large subunit-like protein